MARRTDRDLRGRPHGAHLEPRGRTAAHLRGHEAGVSGIQALAGERYLTWSRRDRTARIWSAQPQPRSVLHFAGGAAKDVQQLSSGSIAVLSNTGSIALFAADLAPGAVLRNGARAVAGLVELADGQLITRGENYANREPGRLCDCGTRTAKRSPTSRGRTQSSCTWRSRLAGGSSLSNAQGRCGHGGPTARRRAGAMPPKASSCTA